MHAELRHRCFREHDSLKTYNPYGSVKTTLMKSHRFKVFVYDSLLDFQGMLRITIVIFSSLATACECSHNFEAGRYSGVSSKEREMRRYDELTRVISQADFCIDLATNGLFEIGIGYQDEGGLYVARQFSWEEVADFLKGQKHRDLVVLRIMPGVDQDRAIISNLRHKLESICFNRIIIVRVLGSGLYLEVDCERPN